LIHYCIQFIIKKKREREREREATNKRRKLFSNTKTLELENVGKCLYKRKCKWEHKIGKLVQNGDEEEM
jgi:hypothetical protein